MVLKQRLSYCMVLVYITHLFAIFIAQGSDAQKVILIRLD